MRNTYMIESLNEHREKLTEDFKKYVSARIRINKLLVLEKSTKLLSKFYSSLSLGVILVLVVLFLSMGGAFITADLLERSTRLGERYSLALGFFIFAGILLAFSFVVYHLVRKITEKPILSDLQDILFITEEELEDENP